MLYLVSTPIGHLSDISLRALETLKTVDYIASEDTRKTGRLLAHYEIKKQQIAFQEYNELKTLPRLIGLLKDGKSIALVTCAGTPSISDPGFTLVRAAIQAGIPVTAVPGASAVIMAVTLSGLPVHSFTFRGFPPRKPVQRQKFIALDAESPHTLIFYESPYRLKAFLEDALTVLGDRQAAVANDLTKMFEQIERDTLGGLIKFYETNEPRGEYVVVIDGLHH